MVRMLRAADLDRLPARRPRPVQVAAERYRLIRTHRPNDKIIERLRRSRVASGSGRLAGIAWTSPDAAASGAAACG